MARLPPIPGDDFRLRGERGGLATMPGNPPLSPFCGLTGRGERGTVQLRKGASGGHQAMFGRIACIALALTFSTLSVTSPWAASFLEKNFWLSGPRYDRDMPACDYAPALDRIIANFHTKEARFWNSQLQIVGIEDVRETAVLPWAAQSIPRRFCSGVALINDGLRHPIYYSIAEDTGMIGMDWGVNFCVVGLDRNWAYEPHCRAARP